MILNVAARHWCATVQFVAPSHQTPGIRGEKCPVCTATPQWVALGSVELPDATK
jgi:hypothetical protein